MSEHSMDETMGDVTRSARLAVMLMAQASEQLARRIAEAQRAAAHDTNERATALREQLNLAQDAARASYEPLTDPARFADSSPETAAAAWSTAAAWSDVDPHAAAAEASLRQQIVERWEVDPQALRDATPPDTSTGAEPAHDAAAETERLTEVMDPEWRENATVEELEARWHDAQNHPERPGAAETLAVLDQELHDRFGLDVDQLRQNEQALNETLWAAAADSADLSPDLGDRYDEDAVAEMRELGLDEFGYQEHLRQTAIEDDLADEQARGNSVVDDRGISDGSEGYATYRMDGDDQDSDLEHQELQRIAEARDYVISVHRPEWWDNVSAPEVMYARDLTTDAHDPDLKYAGERITEEVRGRYGVEVDSVSEEALGEAIDRAAGRERSAGGWENEAHSERKREATAGPDTGQEVEDSVDAREAEGKVTAERSDAEADRGQSRADVDAMQQAGVPGRSQEVRVSTARGFGAGTVEGASKGGQANGRRATARRTADRTHDRGR